MPDDVFLQRMNAAPEHRELAILLRQAIAEQCGLKPETIQDTDECKWLIDKLTMTGGWDTTELLLFLEEHLGVKIDDAVGMKIPYPSARSVRPSSNWREAWFPTLLGIQQDRLTIAEWIHAVIPCIDEHILAPKSQTHQNTARPHGPGGG